MKRGVRWERPAVERDVMVGDHEIRLLDPERSYDIWLVLLATL